MDLSHSNDVDLLISRQGFPCYEHLTSPDWENGGLEAHREWLRARDILSHDIQAGCWQREIAEGGWRK